MPGMLKAAAKIEGAATHDRSQPAFDFHPQTFVLPADISAFEEAAAREPQSL
jgi:hypothetical protein